MLGKKQAFCARLIAILSVMKADFQYSTDFYGMNSYELSHTCMHLLCLAGEASFVFNERCYHIVKNNLVVIPMPDRVCNLAAHADLQVEWFAADYKFLQNLLPSNNYSIGGSISLNQDPVIKLTDEQAQHLLDDFHRLRDRKDDRHTIPILKNYLNDEHLSLTQIADLMNFTSLSYFSRYCTKHLGQSPSEYRQSLQPK